VLIALTDLQRGAQIRRLSDFHFGIPPFQQTQFTAEDLPMGASVKMYGVIVGSGRTDPTRGASYNEEYPSSSCGIPEKTGEFH